MGSTFISGDPLSPLCFLSFALFNLLDFLQFPVGKYVLRTTHLSHSAWLFNNMLLLLFSCKGPETNSASAQRDAMVFPREFHVSGGSFVTTFVIVILWFDFLLLCQNFWRFVLQLFLTWSSKDVANVMLFVFRLTSSSKLSWTGELQNEIIFHQRKKETWKAKQNH